MGCNNSEKIILDCIVCGTGPSFFKYLDNYSPNIPKSGCGISSFYTKLAYYSIGDPIHNGHIADPQYHPGVKIYAHPRVAKYGHIIWDATWPHGGTSGGQALTVACMHHDNIGLIGFDGLDGQKPPTFDPFVIEFKKLIQRWREKGKNLYSLMPYSIFNSELLQYERHTSISPSPRAEST